MRATSSCPDADTIEAFARGQCEEAVAERIAAHLENCQTCWRRLESRADDAALADDARWATETVSKTQVNINVPLERLNALLPEYDIIEEIGRGGMGIVFKARHIKLNRLVALKVLPVLLGVVRPDAAARFRREAELAAKLVHSNIITVYDCGEVEGTLYYVMPLVNGPSLRDVLCDINETGAVGVVIDPASNERRTSAATRLGASARINQAYYRQVATWMAEVAEAVAYAHELGVIHRDIKPSNLLLDRNRHLLVTDFGLARGSVTEEATQSHALLGTARYMAPEQIDRERGPLDERVDVYGIGATLYELLALQPMISAADDAEALKRILDHEPRPPSHFVRHTPPDLETICLKAVEKEPTKRYESARAVADDLRRWLLGMPIYAKRPSLAERVAKHIKRHKLPYALTAASFILGVGALTSMASYRAANRAAAVAQSEASTLKVSDILHNAKAAFAKADFAETMEWVRQGLAIDPQCFDLLEYKARVQWHRNKPQEYCQILKEIIATDPDRWQSHYLLAIAFGKTKFRTDAIYGDLNSSDLTQEERERQYHSHRDEVLRLHPDSAEGDYLLALEQADPRRAIEILDRVLDRDPKCHEAIASKAYAYKELGDFEAMRIEAERCIALCPNLAWAYAIRGEALHELGRGREAIEALDQAIERDSHDPVLWHMRSRAKEKAGRFAEALADANRVIELDERFPLAFACRAKLLSALGQTDNALIDFERALALHPNDATTYLDRGVCHFKAGRFDEASADMTRVIDLAPDHTLAYRNRATIHIIRRRLDAAIVDLRELLRHDPKDAQAWSNLGLALSRSHRYEEALQAYGKAIELDPTVPGDFASRANLFIRMREYERAIPNLTKLLELRPNGKGLTRLKRGLAYELADAPRLALSDYAAAGQVDGAVGQYAEIWRYLLLQRMEETKAAVDVLEALNKSPASNAWIGKLLDLLNGRTEATDVLAAATTDNQRAEAHYYIGCKAMIDGDRDAAAQAFESCVDLKRASILETDFARARLERLSNDTPTIPSPASAP